MTMSSTPSKPAPYRDVRYEFLLIVLTVYSLAIGIILVFAELEPATRRMLLVVDTLNCLFFLGDFFYQLRRVKPRRVFLRLGWIDLIGSIPFIPALRIFRLARLVRASYHKMGMKPREIVAEYLRNRAQSIFLLTTLLTYIMVSTISVAVLQVESASPLSNIKTPGDAVWWAIVTTATVGYGDYYPVTGNGRVLASLLIVMGVAIFGVLASTLASWFIGESSPQISSTDPSQSELQELRQENEALHAELQALRSRLSVIEKDASPEDSSTP